MSSAPNTIYQTQALGLTPSTRPKHRTSVVKPKSDWVLLVVRLTVLGA